MTQYRWGLIAAVAFVYVLSFFLPAAVLNGNLEGAPRPWRIEGYRAFSIALNEAATSWFANPVLWIGLVFLAFGKWRLPIAAGTIAMLLVASELVRNMQLDPGQHTQFLAGYWLWAVSMLLLTAGSAWGWSQAGGEETLYRFAGSLRRHPILWPAGLYLFICLLVGLAVWDGDARVLGTALSKLAFQGSTGVNEGLAWAYLGWGAVVCAILCVVLFIWRANSSNESG